MRAGHSMMGVRHRTTGAGAIPNVGGIHVGDMDAQVGRDLGQQSAGAAIQVVASHHTVAGTHQPEDCCQCCHATGKGKGLISPLQTILRGGAGFGWVHVQVVGDHHMQACLL